MIPRRRKPMKTGLRERPQLRSPQHLRFIKSHECSITGKHDCEGRVEACHVRTGTDGGTGVKPSDNFTVPLCSKAHAEQHNIGEPSFEHRYGISMKLIAATLWLRSPARRKLV